MFRPEVLCIGSATVDNFLTIEQPLSKVKLGDKVLVKSIEKHSGGGGTNSAAALSKLGLQVKLLTKLGEDHDADFILKELRANKIRNICLRHSRKSTDFSTLIFSLPEKDRIIFVHKGASLDLTTNDYHWFQLGAKWIYLATLIGKSFQTAQEIAAYAQKKKVNLLFNPSLYLAQKGKRYLHPVLKAAKVLVLNLEEAQALLKTKISSAPELLKKLAGLGPEIVVITNGEKRIYALADQMTYSALPRKIKVVSTTGAGDAFTSGFLAGMIKKYPVETALQLGMVNSFAVIQHPGAKMGLLTEKEALEAIRRYKLKVVKNRIK